MEPDRLTVTALAVYQIWLEYGEPVSSAQIRSHLRRQGGGSKLEVNKTTGAIQFCDIVEFTNPQNAQYEPSKEWLRKIIRQVRYASTHGAVEG